MVAKRGISSTKRRARAASAPISTPGRELVIVTTDVAGLRAAPGAISSTRGANVGPLAKLLKQHGATLIPMFGNEDRVRRATSTAPPAMRDSVPDLTRFYYVHAPDDRLDRLAKALLDQSVVDGAFIKPPVSPPVGVRRMAPPSPHEAPPVTPNFVAQQLYLDAAPGGINARFAWTRPGGRGRDVRIIDIEGAWRFGHEDMLQNQGGVIGGTQSTELIWRDHGTAVAGVIGADDNTVGVTGICPDANIRAISVFGSGQSSSRAITDAANALGAGDIILVELHRAGPRYNFADRNDQMGYIAVEFWPDDFAAILFATSVRGVIVIEAAGNGAQNLDDALYDTVPSGFPTTWRNPFNLANQQSGAIVVGAGAPPPGTHGRNHGADRSRLDFSNFGARVDVQGWGEEVTTCGYGDLQGGSNEDLWYTDRFSGTSSASPIVVGAVGCLQGGLLARARPLLTPATAREVLRRTGSPQQDEPGRPATERIGNRPDLLGAFRDLGIAVQKDVLKDSKEAVKDHEKVKDGKEKEKEKETLKDTKEGEKFPEKIKEAKESKDGKDKEGKEWKEWKAEGKDSKEWKDKDKEGKDKEGKDLELPEFDRSLPRARSAGERLARLEETVASLAHFIQAGDRPNLRRSALAGEADFAAQLEKQAADAKALKDVKDVEKSREY